MTRKWKGVAGTRVCTTCRQRKPTAQYRAPQGSVCARCRLEKESQLRKLEDADRQLLALADLREVPQLR